MMSVTFAYWTVPQIDVMYCVVLNKFDPKYMVCVWFFVLFCQHFYTPSWPLPICSSGISRKGLVSPGIWPYKIWVSIFFTRLLHRPFFFHQITTLHTVRLASCVAGECALQQHARNMFLCLVVGWKLGWRPWCARPLPGGCRLRCWSFGWFLVHAIMTVTVSLLLVCWCWEMLCATHAITLSYLGSMDDVHVGVTRAQKDPAGRTSCALGDWHHMYI